METKRSILAIIPARGNSKGIKGKNLKNFCGKPLISWTIEEAKKSTYISELIVNSDNNEIIEISRKNGAKIPFIRPDNLALDETPSMDVIIHTIEFYNHKNIFFDYVLLLQCTTPLRNSNDINNAITLGMETNAPSVISVCPVDENPYWMLEVDKKLNCKKLLDNAYSRRQNLPQVFKLNGAIYLAKSELLLRNKTWFYNNTKAYIMDKRSSVDIDNLDDFNNAENIFKNTYFKN